MSNINEPEGALKLAVGLLADMIRSSKMQRQRAQQVAELLGRTVALAEMLEQHGNGEVVLTDSDGSNPISVDDHLHNIRSSLLVQHEVDAALVEQIDNAQMLYEGFLKRYQEDSDESL